MTQPKAQTGRGRWRPIALCAITFVMASCQTGKHSSAYETAPETSRDSLKAQTLTHEAAALIGKNPAKAERLLRDALSADLFHGPAHNNLGVIFLTQGKLYEAAGEFEWARKLMPGHPDPRINLAATLERAGRTGEALANYESALDVAPESIAATQGMVRLQLRTGRSDDRTRAMLEEVALRGEDARWRHWAQERLTLVKGSTP